MPRKPEWIHRIPNVVNVLRNSSAPLVDRRDVEALFAVSSRHAVRLLHRVGATEAGKNLFIARDELIVRLEAIHAGDEVQYERKRLQRMDSVLGDLARDLKARRIAVKTSPAARDLLVHSLHPCVRLRPGRLEIDFETPEELLTRLFELSQAVANDYARFEEMAERGHRPQAPD